MWANLFNGNALLGWALTALLACGLGVWIGRSRVLGTKIAYTGIDFFKLVLKLYAAYDDGKITGDEVGELRAQLRQVLDDLKGKYPAVYDLAIYEFAVENHKTSKYAAKCWRAIQED